MHAIILKGCHQLLIRHLLNTFSAVIKRKYTWGYTAFNLDCIRIENKWSDFYIKCLFNWVPYCYDSSVLIYLKSMYLLIGFLNSRGEDYQNIKQWGFSIFLFLGSNTPLLWQAEKISIYMRYSDLSALKTWNHIQKLNKMNNYIHNLYFTNEQKYNSYVIFTITSKWDGEFTKKTF